MTRHMHFFFSLKSKYLNFKLAFIMSNFSLLFSKSCEVRCIQENSRKTKLAESISRRFDFLWQQFAYSAPTNQLAIPLFDC